MGEGKMAFLALALALPLAVHIDLGDFHRVPHLQNRQHTSRLNKHVETTQATTEKRDFRYVSFLVLTMQTSMVHYTSKE